MQEKRRILDALSSAGGPRLRAGRGVRTASASTRRTLYGQMRKHNIRRDDADA
jgi:hypothetical protein